MQNKTYIIFDLEATCEDRKIKANFDNHIIEIGAVKYVNGSKVSEFQTFVNPKDTLTAFCKDLTKITQADVDSAPFFEQAIEEFTRWALDKSENGNSDVVFASWGGYDKKQIIWDSNRYNLNSSWIENSHINFKQIYADLTNSKQMGMKRALSKEGIKLSGTHHRGIDDARNIGKIFEKYQDKL